MRLLLAAALTAGLTAPASAAPTKQDIISTSILVIAAANTCPAGTIPSDVIPVVLFSYTQAMGIPMNEEAARRLDLMGNLAAIRIKQEGQHEEMCRDAKKAMLRATTF